jgi:hypothetical protein
MKRITLCKYCHDTYYPDTKLPEGTAVYMATGICKHCKEKTSVKRYEIENIDEGEEAYKEHLDIFG